MNDPLGGFGMIWPVIYILIEFLLKWKFGHKV